MEYLKGDILEITKTTVWYKKGEIAEITHEGRLAAKFPTQKGCQWYLEPGTFRHKVFTLKEAAKLKSKQIKRILELQPELQDHFIKIEG